MNPISFPTAPTTVATRRDGMTVPGTLEVPAAILAPGGGAPRYLYLAADFDWRFRLNDLVFVLPTGAALGAGTLAPASDREQFRVIHAAGRAVLAIHEAA